MSGGWNTIESDAAVFTFLIESLGTTGVQCEELITLDADSLQTLNPYGVIFLFKYQSGQGQTADRPVDGEYDYDSLNDENPVWFAAQTIQNACGTQALLSVLLNQGQRVQLGEGLNDFKSFTAAFPADLRGEALSNYDRIRDTHNSFARSSPFVSDETKLATDDDDVYHFVAYTSINDSLYELDGLRPAPIRHGDPGSCPAEIFADAVVPVLQRRIERYPPNEIRFNLLAVCEDLRLQAERIGDGAAVAAEEARRKEWKNDIALKQSNLLGFVSELIKGVTAQKIQNNSWDAWIDGAKKKTADRVSTKARRGEQADEG